jgi:hypothetical protein
MRWYAWPIRMALLGAPVDARAGVGVSARPP